MDKVTHKIYLNCFPSLPYLKSHRLPHPQRYIYVVAENYAAFRAYCIDEGFTDNPKSKDRDIAMYVYDAQMLRGYRNIDIVLYDRYYLADPQVLHDIEWMVASGSCRLFLGRNRRAERIAEEKREMNTRVKLMNRAGFEVGIVEVPLTEDQVTDLKVLVNKGLYYLNDTIRERATGLHVFCAINRNTGIYTVKDPEPTDLGEIDKRQAEKIKKQISDLNLELDSAKKRGLQVRIDTDPFNRLEDRWIRREY